MICKTCVVCGTEAETGMCDKCRDKAKKCRNGDLLVTLEPLHCNRGHIAIQWAGVPPCPLCASHAEISRLYKMIGAGDDNDL